MAVATTCKMMSPASSKALAPATTATATRLLHSKNESLRQPAINLQIARAYLMAVDPLVGKRSWRRVMEEIVKFKKGSTLQRWQTAVKDKAFDSIRDLALLETQAEQLLRVLEKGTVSTNVHLCKLHNFLCLSGSLTNSILRIYTGFELAHWLGPEASKNPNRIRRNHWHNL